MTKKLVTLLGVNGTLSEAVIRNLVDHRSDEVDLFGFDVQDSTTLPVGRYQQCDLRSRESIRAAVQAIPYGDYNDFRLLICASVMNLVSLESGVFGEDAFYESAQINLAGPAHFATAFALRCVEAKAKARVVAIGSTAAYIGSNDPAYAMAKAGLDGLVRSLSKYLAAKGVTAMAVHTGIFPSGMQAQVSDARQAKTIEGTHLKRKATVAEVEGFVTYYLLDAPDFATGMSVDINGGQHT
jgi:NAD(P)-dependent dehydrogenase (short-subunit alcohol dehydrogenase family)